LGIACENFIKEKRNVKDEWKSEQEAFWAGEFGNEYILRTQHLSFRQTVQLTCLWTDILRKLPSIPHSILELGSSAGRNLHILHALMPEVELAAVEINSHAAGKLREWGQCAVYEQSILTFNPDKKYDYVFTSGVFIHIDPRFLNTAYDVIYNASSRYLSIAEYYNPTPVEVTYRSHSERLFKRDFAGEILDRYPDVRVVSYGFAYRRDPWMTGDDTTWFMMRKD
jgi:spore coat polysaccharide biosynthesis protein SpsF